MSQLVLKIAWYGRNYIFVAWYSMVWYGVVWYVVT
jgi:hypothetical protein